MALYGFRVTCEGECIEGFELHFFENVVRIGGAINDVAHSDYFCANHEGEGEE